MNNIITMLTGLRPSLTWKVCFLWIHFLVCFLGIHLISSLHGLLSHSLLRYLVLLSVTRYWIYKILMIYMMCLLGVFSLPFCKTSWSCGHRGYRHSSLLQVRRRLRVLQCEVLILSIQSACFLIRKRSFHLKMTKKHVDHAE